MTYALTLWQPWASLIMLGAKPWEFRRWRAPASFHGERIVIHAAVRPLKMDEIDELLAQFPRGQDEGLAGPALKIDIARPMLERVRSGEAQLPLSAGLGTAVLAAPRRASALFKGPDVDPDVWAWPMHDVQPFDAPIPARGAQGFWSWTDRAPYEPRLAEPTRKKAKASGDLFE